MRFAAFLHPHTRHLFRTTMATAQGPIILELEGMYPDSGLEDALFSSSGYIYHTPRLGLHQPTTDVPAEILQRTEGLFMFRRWLTAADIDLFPNLKVGDILRPHDPHVVPPLMLNIRSWSAWAFVRESLEFVQR